MASPLRQTTLGYCTHSESRGRRDPEKQRSVAAVSGRGRSGWHKFVSRNLRGDPHAAILGRLDAHNVPLASNVHVPGLRHLLGKRDDEVNLASDFEVGFGQEVQSPVTEISRVRVQLAPFGSLWHHAQG